MTLYQHMLVFYGIVASVAALITFFIAKDKLSIKLLSAFSGCATWPMSFPGSINVRAILKFLSCRSDTSLPAARSSHFNQTPSPDNFA